MIDSSARYANVPVGSPYRKVCVSVLIHRGARRSSPAFNEMFSRSEEDTHGT